VIACGGLETTRLLLIAQQRKPDAFGGPGGPLGCGYIGHISGKLAEIVFDNPSTAADFDFMRDGDVYVRRRYTLKSQALLEEQLQNIAMWVDNPPFYNTSHKNGLLSAIWLALAIPFIGRRIVSEGVRRAHVGPRPHHVLKHLANVIIAPHKTLSVLLRIVRGRFLQRPSKPGFLILNEGGRYALHFHAEQRANSRSRVTLSDERDALGMPRLLIDFRFDAADAASVVRAHEILDNALRSAKEGRLEYWIGAAERLELVMLQAADGFHQIGTTRMGSSPKTSVVDANCQVHGSRNLFIASSSVFPSSGQANPTFLGVALACRLATFIAHGRPSVHSDVRSGGMRRDGHCS
jgi:hypothetical protein